MICIYFVIVELCEIRSFWTDDILFSDFNALINPLSLSLFLSLLLLQDVSGKHYEMSSFPETRLEKFISKKWSKEFIKYPFMFNIFDLSKVKSVLTFWVTGTMNVVPQRYKQHNCRYMERLLRHVWTLPACFLASNHVWVRVWKGTADCGSFSLEFRLVCCHYQTGKLLNYINVQSKRLIVPTFKYCIS